MSEYDLWDHAAHFESALNTDWRDSNATPFPDQLIPSDPDAVRDIARRAAHMKDTRLRLFDSSRLSRDESFAMRNLPISVRKVLNCKNPDCLRACARCLHEYSNQMIWHELDRRPALDWIKAILSLSD